jgi:hypothetical protein
MARIAGSINKNSAIFFAHGYLWMKSPNQLSFGAGYFHISSLNIYFYAAGQLYRHLTNA